MGPNQSQSARNYLDRPDVVMENGTMPLKRQVRHSGVPPTRTCPMDGNGALSFEIAGRLNAEWLVDTVISHPSRLPCKMS